MTHQTDSGRIENVSHLGRYVVINVLGEGGMGRVYLAEDPVLQRKLAIKVITINKLLDPQKKQEYIDRFLLEARASARLSHHSIVAVFDVGQNDGLPWIAFEYIDGERLSDLIRRTSPPNDRNPELFDILDRTLDRLETARGLDSVLFHFELKYAAHLGLGPQLGNCAKCNNAAPGMAFLFSPSRGAITCVSCGSSDCADGKAVSPDVLAMMRAWKKSGRTSAANTLCTDSQSRTIRKMLGRFLEYHLDFKAASRNIALDCVRFDVNGKY